MIASPLVKKSPALIAILLLAGAVAASQQSGGGGMGGMQNPNSMPSQGTSSMPQPGIATTGTGQNNMRRMADQSFVRSTLANDDAQVRLSQLAEQKSTSQDVKQFSQNMVKAHSQLNLQLGPVAKQLDVRQPKGPSKKEKKEIAKLQTLSGPAFDSAYIEAMAKEQEQSLKKFKDESKATQNAVLQEAAQRDEPVLSQHYTVLKQIAQAHNIPIGKKGKK